jgi:hypothetical protein
VIFEYNATPDSKIQWSVAEKFEFDNDGLIEKSSVYYGKEDGFTVQIHLIVLSLKELSTVSEAMMDHHRRKS